MQKTYTAAPLLGEMSRRPVKLYEVKNLEKWAAQNAADVMECECGCLLDNFVFSCRRGYAFIYETYQNTWASFYTMKFISYKAAERDPRALNALWQEWQDFADAIKEA